MRVSIICVYNNKKQLEQCLIQSLNKQSIEYELVLVDGTGNIFHSCANALNYGVSKAKGDILIFTHQDIYLKEYDSLLNFSNFINMKPTGCVVGAAGAIEKKQKNLGNYTTGELIDNRLLYNLYSPKEVSCVDECFFGMKRSTFDLHAFDEEVCDNWHLYAVEQCLYHRNNGGKVFVYPLQFHHLSNGKINLKYMDGLLKIVVHYKGKFKYIWTTCYKIRNNYLYVKMLRWFWIINRKIRKRDL